MARIDLVLLHAPSVYDFRERSIMFGPVSDMVPSSPIFEMYPLGFTTMAEYTAGTVGDAWQQSGENSAFYGSFSFEK